MGINIFGVPGPSLLHDEADATTFDYNLINNVTFFANTVHDYLVIEPLCGPVRRPGQARHPASSGCTTS